MGGRKREIEMSFTANERYWETCSVKAAIFANGLVGVTIVTWTWQQWQWQNGVQLSAWPSWSWSCCWANSIEWFSAGAASAHGIVAKQKKKTDNIAAKIFMGTKINKMQCNGIAFFCTKNNYLFIRWVLGVFKKLINASHASIETLYSSSSIQIFLFSRQPHNIQI